jgi:hypothetical protein
VRRGFPFDPSRTPWRCHCACTHDPSGTGNASRTSSYR